MGIVLVSVFLIPQYVKKINIIEVDNIVPVIVQHNEVSLQERVLREKSAVSEQKIIQNVETTFSLIILGETYIIPFTEGDTLYHALDNAKQAGRISFLGKEYQGLGFLVTDIGTLHNGNGLYLFYYINSKEASVGVSSYILRSGDTIEWKLK